MTREKGARWQQAGISFIDEVLRFHRNTEPLDVMEVAKHSAPYQLMSLGVEKRFYNYGPVHGRYS